MLRTFEEQRAIAIFWGMEKIMFDHRLHNFLTEEMMGTFENIFTPSDTKKDSLEEAEEDLQTIEDENIASIQHILQGNLSDDSDDDDEEEEEEGVDDPQAYPLSDHI